MRPVYQSRSRTFFCGTITWTIPSIAANGVKDVSFESDIDDAAETGTVYSNTVKITSVNGAALTAAADQAAAEAFRSKK